MKRSKHGLFVFPPKKTLIWRRHCTIGQLCCSMTSKRNIDWFLESSRAWSFFTLAFASPTKSHARFYPFDKSIKSLYSGCLFLFCWHVFILKSYGNRSKKRKIIELTCYVKMAGYGLSFFVCLFVSVAAWNFVGLYFFPLYFSRFNGYFFCLFLQRHQTFYSDKNVPRFWLGIRTNRSTLFVGQEMLFRKFRALIPSTSLRLVTNNLI